MSEFDPAPDTASTETSWPEGMDTFDRVYDVVLGLSELTDYHAIADTASCSVNAAKKHLDRLAEMGVARADTEARPARYARDEGYLEFREASRIAADLSVEEIVERVERLEAERNSYEDRFGTTDPSSVDVFAGDHETAHKRMTAVSDWRATIRDIRLHELARQLAQHGGHLVHA
ncbi:hypothetical protein GCM10009037_19970 [Halarchaeum grantii]|uniref:Sugar-specific transcriptional regulator TrmB n=1 Tax=Halarchaeum grantii TaxID=1193105 RepID=A0A830F3Q7_9EURY|nr:sugar-specific transcriptional regulator TrmB [Halarchaeum grantii]GGL36380.1 hypothetical protein GCM10009037_19970 [Halarchaeum grantii]